MRIKKLLYRSLEDADVVRVREIIEDDNNQAGLEEEAMDLVPVVCSYLTKETQEALPHLARSCEDVLAALARLGSPKEVLMAQMEQMDSFQHPAQVVSMLPSLARVLTRVKVSNMSVSWTWALGTVGCHLMSVASGLMSVATGHPRQHGPRGGGEAQSGADPGGPGVSAAVRGLCCDVRAASGHHPEGQ